MDDDQLNMNDIIDEQYLRLDIDHNVVKENQDQQEILI